MAGSKKRFIDSLFHFFFNSQEFFDRFAIYALANNIFLTIIESLAVITITTYLFLIDPIFIFAGTTILPLIAIRNRSKRQSFFKKSFIKHFSESCRRQLDYEPVLFNDQVAIGQTGGPYNYQLAQALESAELNAKKDFLEHFSNSVTDQIRLKIKFLISEQHLIISIPSL